MKKMTFALVTVFTVAWAFTFSSFASGQQVTVSGSYFAGAPEVSAASAIVIEQSTGRVLYEKNADLKKYPASTTKIMTALLAIESYPDMNRMIKVPKEAAGVEGSSIYLKEGEEISVKDLLFGLMLRSGNDAAVAIAHDIGGSSEEFVEMMNRRAEELGCVNTHFMNPNGLHDDSHYTTARELADISRAAMQNEAFSYIVGSKSWMASRELGDFTHFFNKNKVIFQYDGGTGVKTGYTTTSGRCLVASSQRDGMRLICVVMQAPDWFSDAYKLMDYAYGAYECEKLVSKGQVVSTVMISNGQRDTARVVTRDDIAIPRLKGEEGKATVVYDIIKKKKAPVERWEQCGSMKIYWDGEFLSEVELYIAEDVDKKPNAIIAFFQNLM